MHSREVLLQSKQPVQEHLQQYVHDQLYAGVFGIYPQMKLS